MTKASDNEFPSVLFDEQPSDVSTPASGFWRAFFKSDGMYVIDDAGTVTGPFGAGGTGDVATDPIWDAKGDLAGGTAANAAARLAVGGNGSILMAASGETTGLKWMPFTIFDAPSSADATIVNANTYQDATGCSQSCAAGTWLFWWKIQFSVIVTTSQGYQFTGKLWDGASGVYDESEIDSPVAGNYNGASWHTGGFALVVLGSTTTVKISGACNRGSSASKVARNAPTNSPTSNAATRLTGMRIA